jgi:DNA repair exonuclease SbcCD ATPase subunit
VDDVAIARSIDRRAKLKDRLGTSAELSGENTVFSQLLADDASSKLHGLQPRVLYPIKLRRIHLLSVAGIAIVASILFLSNAKFFLPKEAIAEKESMKKESKRLEDLRKAIFDDATDKKSTSPELLALQKDLMKLQKDYEKARIDPKEAMLKAEELSKKADELAKKSAVQELDKLKESESMLDKMKKEELQKAGFEKADMDSVKMSDADFDQKMEATQQKSEKSQSKVSELQKKLDSLKAQLNKPGLDQNAKKDLENQIKSTEQELKDAQSAAEKARKELESMQFSKEARAALKKIFDDPLYKKLQEGMRKMTASAQQAAKTGQPTLTKEQRQKLQKEMEEFLKKMADDDFRKEYLQKLLDALKDGCGT